MKKIKKEEIAVEHLKTKYNQLMSGNKAPASLSSMESQLKKTEKELKELETQYNSTANQISQRQIDLEWAKNTGDAKQVSNIEFDQNKLDIQSINIATKLEDARDKASRLKKEIENLKMNPQTSMEVQNLKAKIDNATNSLEKSKQEANDLATEILKVSKVNLNSINTSLKNLGNTLTKSLTGRNGLKNGLDSVNSGLDKFKNKMTRLISTAMVFNLIRQGLTALSRGFISLLKTNDDFSNSLNQIKVNLLTAFAPIYEYILPAINSLMNALSQVTGSIASFIAGIFGKTANQAKNNAKQLYNQANAQEAVNEAQENLASFDKLEVNNGNSTSSGTSKNFDSINFDTPIEVKSDLLNFFNELKNLIGDGKWFDVGAKIANSLNSILEKVDVKTFFEKGKILAENIANGINGFMATFDWQNFAIKISEVLLGAYSMLLNFIKELDWQLIGRSICDFLLNIDWLGLGLKIIEILIQGLLAIGDLIIGICDSIINAFTSPEFLNGILEGGINIIMGLIQGMLSVFEKIKEAFLKIIELFLSLFGIHSPSTLFEEYGINIIQGLINGIQTLIPSILSIFANMWDNLSNGGKTALEAIKKIFGNIATFFGNVFGNAWEKVKQVFSSGGKIFDGIKEGILNAFKNVVNALINGINKVVSKPFNGLNNVLNTIQGIEFFGIKPFNFLTWRAQIPEIPIPYLATGAVIPPNAKFAAVLGDQRNGKNLEAPESLVRKIVREESGNNEVILNGTFIIQCDTGEEFGRASMRGIRLLENIDGKAYLVN